MLLFLRSKDQILAARERLTALGVEYHIGSSEPVLEIRSHLSIYPPEVLAAKLADLGRVEITHSRTPLLDKLANGHEVLVEAKGRREPIRFRNQPQQAIWIAGPCSLDESNNLHENAKRLSQLGVQVLRGGAVKPRTSPHEFQGVGRAGYAQLAEAAHAHGMACISETLSEDDVAEATEFLDIIQVGARNMQNFALLRKLGRCNKPIMLKRAPGATLQEWASAAEYMLAEGNRRIILCERGVRGLEQELRYTLDFAGAVFMQQRYSLPMVIDPSHATGVKQVLEACTAGTIAMGFAGVMLETHPKPVEARSDALQALTPDEFAAIAGKHLQAD